MKTNLSLLVTVVAAALFGAGCASVDSSVDNAKLKTFSDKEIEKVIRVAIGKPEGELTEVDYLKVGRIDLHDRKINDISMLAKCKNLSVVRISYNPVFEDISPLKNLRKLRDLDLDSCNLSDLSPLAKLTNLVRLAVPNNNISDITPIADLRKLEELDIVNTRIVDISVLGNISSLKFLRIHHTPIMDISPLKGLNLVKFGAEGTLISNVDALKEMKTLREVRLSSSLVASGEANELLKLVEKNRANDK
jgi:internalin A